MLYLISNTRLPVNYISIKLGGERKKNVRYGMMRGIERKIVGRNLKS